MAKRPNWYRRHPPACTCVQCAANRQSVVPTEIRERARMESRERTRSGGTPSGPPGASNRSAGRQSGSGCGMAIGVIALIAIIAVVLYFYNDDVRSTVNGIVERVQGTPAPRPTSTATRVSTVVPTQPPLSTTAPESATTHPSSTSAAVPPVIETGPRPAAGSSIPTPVAIPPRPSPTTLPPSPPTPAWTPTPVSIQIPASTPAQIPTPLPSEPPPTPSPTRIRRLTPTPALTPSSIPGPEAVERAPESELAELKSFALDLINGDRASHGLQPVALGTNPAAQLHAEDMLAYDYQGHWWSDGRKPYMVYSETAGTTYVAENAASSGWTAERWQEKNCDSAFVRCIVSDPRESIETLQWGMMYDDAHADWGHRDNILRGTHRAVNIGIAWNKRRVTFIQHFEGGDVKADAPPALSSNGTLTLSMEKEASGVKVGGVVSVYFDPIPVPMTSRQIDALDSYCAGGGQTTRCGDPVARILDPPPPRSFYSDLDANEVVADSWEETADSFSFTASLGGLATTPGVYTVTVWRDSGTRQLSEVLAQLSVVQP